MGKTARTAAVVIATSLMNFRVDQNQLMSDLHKIVDGITIAPSAHQRYVIGPLRSQADYRLLRKNVCIGVLPKHQRP